MNCKVLKKAEGRGQKGLFRRGFRPLLKRSNQIFDLVGVLNPWLPLVAQKDRASTEGFILLPSAFCLLPFWVKVCLKQKLVVCCWHGSNPDFFFERLFNFA